MELWFNWETNALVKAEVALHSGALGLPDKLKWDCETVQDSYGIFSLQVKVSKYLQCYQAYK